MAYLFASVRLFPDSCMNLLSHIKSEEFVALLTEP